MAKSKQSPPSEAIPYETETIDENNKAVIDDSTSLSQRGVSPMPLDLRIAAMLGMGLDTVRDRLRGKDQAALLKLVEAKSHADLSAMLTVPARSASEG
jgi:hypothetical protein